MFFFWLLNTPCVPFVCPRFFRWVTFFLKLAVRFFYSLVLLKLCGKRNQMVVWICANRSIYSIISSGFILVFHCCPKMWIFLSVISISSVWGIQMWECQKGNWLTTFRTLNCWLSKDSTMNPNGIGLLHSIR